MVDIPANNSWAAGKAKMIKGIEYQTVEVHLTCGKCGNFEVIHVDYTLAENEERTLRYAPGWAIGPASSVYCPNCYPKVSAQQAHAVDAEPAHITTQD